ncbi:HAMP domain-containing sensor histidine kinase [Xylanivirga thermophila]|jgi:signal transduction histidine kinase|uniref:HAMP domain-containing sensor histidine kinase n=1 Tax=Xylanivirga thermophila TaxID=2496273 RepID=UPI00101C76E7|nr:HAMP domain-containing sensor histidine kinase [Xylanivirga thermophila]
MKSIKKRLIANFVCIILISVIILELLLIYLVKQYYYANAEEVLSNQIRLSSDFYTRYFSNTPLSDNILDNVDVFWKQTSAEVQIIDTSGQMIMDSIGFMPEGRMETSDIKKALSGSKGVWIGNVPYDSVKVMAVSYPLISERRIVGAIRFVTSLREVHKEIQIAVMAFVIIGIIVAIISIIVSMFLANSIAEPLKEVTYAAHKMASGDFEVRSQKVFDDEVGQLSDTLNYMADEIVKKDNLKNEFLSSVSHELRTPLTSIKGWAMTLNSGQQPIDEKLLGEGLKIIENESDRLTSMVEELLDFSRLASRKMTLKKKISEITIVIEYIKNHMTPLAARNNIDFIVEYPDNLPLVEIDEDRIKQVFINVLDNAFKFTQQGGQVIFKAEYDNGYIDISISDNGCGISPDDLPRVKEKFFKGKNSKSKNGIGLSICNEIINLHKGSLKIQSELEKGTTVFIKLPVKDQKS